MRISHPRRLQRARGAPGEAPPPTAHGAPPSRRPAAGRTMGLIKVDVATENAHQLQSTAATGGAVLLGRRDPAGPTVGTGLSLSRGGLSTPKPQPAASGPHRRVSDEASDDRQSSKKRGFFSRLLRRQRSYGADSGGHRRVATPSPPPPFVPATPSQPAVGAGAACGQPPSRRQPATQSWWTPQATLPSASLRVGGDVRGSRRISAGSATAAAATSHGSPDVVYLAPLEFRGGVGSSDSLRSSRSDNSTVNLRWLPTEQTRRCGHNDGEDEDDSGEEPFPPPPAAEWIVPAVDRHVVFDTAPQKAMHGRKHAHGGGGLGRTHRQHKGKTKSAHGTSHTKRSHGRRAKRPAAHNRYHLRRRYLLHGGAMGGEEGAAAAAMFGMGDDMFEEGEDSDMLQMRFNDTDSDDEEADDDDAAAAVAGDDRKADGPPALENEDQVHVFFFYVGGGTEVDIVEHYIGELEGSPHELKCMSNERDYKGDLSAMQNVVLAFGLSQRTVVLCTQEFIDNEYEAFIAAANLVMTEEEKRLKVFVLLPQDVDLPKGLLRHRVFELSNDDALANLTKVLSSGPVPKELYKVEPTAPPLDTVADDGVSDPQPAADAPKEPPPLYQNGTVVKRITADNYREFELYTEEDNCRSCRSCVGDCDLFCPLPEPHYEVPQQLRKRGLLVQQDEFQEILQALSDASRIKFFHKAVDCSLPCLYLCIILVAVAVLAPLWFISVGTVKYYRPQEDHSSAIFWSFLLCIVILPTLIALSALLLLVHLANAKYAKFRGKIEEFNKRFRETNLVLHCRRAYWYCSGRLKLFFLYYNFEECQQNLYYQVYEHMKFTGNGSTCNSSTTGHTMVGSDLNGNGHVPSGSSGTADAYSHGDYEQDIPTLKMDKILKRVNTLRKKYEWDYFEELVTKKLPEVDERQHRKGGMCFCQYALRRNMHDDPVSWAEILRERAESTLRNAFRKSHVRRQLRKSTNLHAVNGNGCTGSNGTVRHSKPDVVYI